MEKDGRAIDSAIKSSPDFASAYLNDTDMQDKKAGPERIRHVQEALNRLGYDSGDADGIKGQRTAEALRRYQQDHPALTTGESSGLNTLAGTPRASVLSPEERIGLRPDLLALIDKGDPKVALVMQAKKAAEDHGVNFKTFLNQCMKESGFDPNVVGDKGERGICQMTPATGRAYGLKTGADFRDPAKTSDAGARYMRDLLDQNHGDELRATIAYNGGGKALRYVEKQLGHPVTGQEWMDFMATQDSKNPNAWSNRTVDYVNGVVADRQPSAVAARQDEDRRLAYAPVEPAATASRSSFADRLDPGGGIRTGVDMLRDFMNAARGILPQNLFQPVIAPGPAFVNKGPAPGQ